jgi:hypothetical protein
MHNVYAKHLFVAIHWSNVPDPLVRVEDLHAGYCRSRASC